MAILTAGPGVTDGVTGVANAWRANSPILVIGGQGPFDNLRRGSLQEMDHVSVMRPITKCADACYETARIGEYIELAIRHAVSGVPGPAFLEIPMDVLAWADRCRLDRAADDSATTASQSTAPHAPIDEAARAIIARPPTTDGDGGHRPEVVGGRPGAATVRRGDQHPGVHQRHGSRAAADEPSAVLQPQPQGRARPEPTSSILAGTPLDFRMQFGASIPADAKIIQLDLDETLIGQNRSADVGLVGNLGANLDAMLDASRAARASVDFCAHSADAAGDRGATPRQALAAQLDSDEVPIDPLRLCREIADFIATDDEMIVIGDGGDIVAQAAKVLPVPDERHLDGPGTARHARRRHAVRAGRAAGAPGPAGR